MAIYINWSSTKKLLVKFDKRNRADKMIKSSSSSSSSMLLKLKHNYEILSSDANDPAVWKERRSLVEQQFDFDPNSELDLVEELIVHHPNHNSNHYLTWDYRRWLVEKIGSLAANNELQFTGRLILSSKTKKLNYQAWFHREWVIHNFDIRSLWLPELQFCHQVLEKDKFNISAWDHICRAARYTYDLDDGMRLSEAIFAKEAIRAQPGNEGPWMYLKVLYAQHKESLYTNPDLECIYVDVLCDEVDRVKLAMVLDPDYDMACATVDKRGCVHALRLIADLVIVAGYNVINNTRLVDAVKFVFAYSRPAYTWVHPDDIWKKHKKDKRGILNLVRAATFALDACRIRYCYKYRGIHIGYGENGKSPVELEEKYENKFCVEYVDSTPQSSERLRFESFVALLCEPEVIFNNIFTLHPEWKECLFQTYVHKRTRAGNDDTTLQEDLKWDLRRCVVKFEGTNAAALDELESTTKLINDDASNRRAWSHRQWVFQTFGGDWEDEEELKFCDEILREDACNNFAWDQRYFVITRMVPKILAAKGPKMYEGSAVYEKVHGLEQSLENKRGKEADYAIEFIDVEPENQLPWSHIIGLFMAYPGFFRDNVRAKDAIMRVLEGARQVVLGLDLWDGVMGGGGSRYAINARGITNALNMLLDIIINHEYTHFLTREQGMAFIRAMDELCPDSCISEHPARINKCDIHDKSTFILRQMDNSFPCANLLWE